MSFRDHVRLSQTSVRYCSWERGPSFQPRVSRSMARISTSISKPQQLGVDVGEHPPATIRRQRLPQKSAKGPFSFVIVGGLESLLWVRHGLSEASNVLFRSPGPLYSSVTWRAHAESSAFSRAPQTLELQDLSPRHSSTAYIKSANTKYFPPELVWHRISSRENWYRRARSLRCLAARAPIMVVLCSPHKLMPGGVWPTSFIELSWWFKSCCMWET